MSDHTNTQLSEAPERLWIDARIITTPSMRVLYGEPSPDGVASVEYVRADLCPRASVAAPQGDDEHLADPRGNYTDGFRDGWKAHFDATGPASPSLKVEEISVADLPFDDYCAGKDCRACRGINCTCPHHAQEASSPLSFSALAEWLDMLVTALKASQKYDYNEWGQFIMGAENWADKLRASAPQGDAGISWTALLSVLERLRSKNRNPDNVWYHGWNAAIQCLINDINARSSSPDSSPVPPEHHFIVTQTRDKCGYSGCELGPLEHPEVPKHNFPAATSTPGPPPTTAGQEQVFTHNYGGYIVYERRKAEVEIPNPSTSEAAKAHGLRRIHRRHYHPENAAATTPVTPSDAARKAEETGVLATKIVEAVADCVEEPGEAPGDEWWLDRASAVARVKKILAPFTAPVVVAEGGEDRDQCAWTLDDVMDGDVWETSCGETFQFTDGGPSDNNFAFCYKCGKRISAGRYSDHAADTNKHAEAIR